MTETRAPYCSGPRAEPAPAAEPSRPKHPLRVDRGRRLVVADFPGCRPVRISRDEIDSWEGRFEVWDARDEIAMVAEITTTYHEYPSQRLVRLTEIIAQSRGSPIDTVGTADLLLRDDAGDRARIMQADQTVYLHPARDRPRGASMEVGQKLPDVVLEVDHTTDVYRRKIELYESWGFPELWVEVPAAPSRSRPRRKLPGLRIHVLNAAGRFEERTESAAFAGWTATAIHRALNEEALSAETTATLRRIGRALGEREGTNPDDSPFLRAERAEARIAGKRELLQALAAVHLGTTAAEKLATRLAEIDDQALLASVLSRLVAGATEAELVELL